MFGHRQLPAWASCVSSELARILHNECIMVAGLILDDYLFIGRAHLGPDHLQTQLDKTDAIMEDLNLPSNDKGLPPDTSNTFVGIRVDTLIGEFNVDEDHRLYTLQ